MFLYDSVHIMNDQIIVFQTGNFIMCFDIFCLSSVSLHNSGILGQWPKPCQRTDDHFHWWHNEKNQRSCVHCQRGILLCACIHFVCGRNRIYKDVKDLNNPLYVRVGRKDQAWITEGRLDVTSEAEIFVMISCHMKLLIYNAFLFF